ncbi:MAG: hypothetical protein R3E12_09335 [Candidatus Eisenbacteria bacterium]|uniref:Outer membrane protein beta-barrel domain-containing protein n=1 Tax=Eiseniibacteriota bacterium TaxID=2212470 RepID=A0A956M4D5_UNCEI|nr:hypothetical protein [Candidatus Eisenbacteria bacterium]
MRRTQMISIVMMSLFFVPTIVAESRAFEHEILVSSSQIAITKTEYRSTYLAGGLGWRAAVDPKVQLGFELAGVADLSDPDVESGLFLFTLTMNPGSTDGVSPYVSLKGGVAGSNSGPNVGAAGGEVGVRIPITERFVFRPSFELIRPLKEGGLLTRTFSLIGFSVFID